MRLPAVTPRAGRRRANRMISRQIRATLARSLRTCVRSPRSRRPLTTNPRRRIDERAQSPEGSSSKSPAALPPGPAWLLARCRPCRRRRRRRTPATTTSPTHAKLVGSRGQAAGQRAGGIHAIPTQSSPCTAVKMGKPVAGGVGPDGDIVAYSTLCTHMGCPVSYDANARVFKCPCHFSMFDAEMAGQMICGQATENLPQIVLEYDAKDGTVTAVGVERPDLRPPVQHSVRRSEPWPIARTASRCRRSTRRRPT